MAKMENLVDNFDGNSIKPQWSLTGGGTPASQILNINGRLEITTTGVAFDYETLQSATTYDLTSSYAAVQVINIGSQAANVDFNPVLLQIDASNLVWWNIDVNTIAAFKKVTGSQTNIASTAYNASVHRWFRIREAGGITYWDYSSDGEAWINFTNQANPISVTALFGCTQTGQFGGAASTTTVIDNFNFRNSGYQRIGVGDGMSRSEVAN